MNAPAILVLEDDEVLRLLLMDIVEDTGQDAVAFASADEGMRYLEESNHQLSLIVSDINMPGILDGYELSKIVTLRWPLLPMILTSGAVSSVLELGANVRFLPKPWMGNAMLDLVVRALDQPRRHHSG